MEMSSEQIDSKGKAVIEKKKLRCYNFNVQLADLVDKGIVTTEEDKNNFKYLTEGKHFTLDMWILLRNISKNFHLLKDILGHLPKHGDIITFFHEIKPGQKGQHFIYDGEREKIEELCITGRDQHFCIPDRFGKLVCKDGNYNFDYYRHVVNDAIVDFTHISWFDELMKCEIVFIAEEKVNFSDKIMRVYLIKQKEGSVGHILINSIFKEGEIMTEEDNIKKAVIDLCYEPTNLQRISDERYELWFPDKKINKRDILCMYQTNQELKK